MDDQSHNPPPKDGARMILPGHLNKLLEIFPTGQIVVIDLRPRADYQRSHIHGAINFRAPASFVSRASMEMIEKALTDEASRSSFDKWYTSKCVVFYDKVVEYPWEAPVAEAFFRKFKSKHWPGQCFVLKGHYREFSQSFDKYIVGFNTTDKATEYLASLQDVSWEKSVSFPSGQPLSCLVLFFLGGGSL
jgi:rhodanese-related sulfurtransferase